ncbi:MAG: AI-2E family transporter [Clostridia bacterium]|nr:AI-2E family transporter [Clostridia bacterium]
MDSAKKKTLLIGGIVYALVFLLVVMILNLSAFNEWLQDVLLLLRPILIGLILAYLLNSFFRFFERKVFERIQPFRLRRGISIFFTYLTLLLIFVVLLLLIVPQLVESILDFLNNYESFLAKTTAQVNDLIGFFNAKLPSKDGHDLLPYLDVDILTQTVSNFIKSLNLNTQDLMDYLTTDNIFAIFDFASDVVSLVTDILFGLFISLYLLLSKEKRYAQVMRLRKALFSDTVNRRITRLCTIADHSFGGFLEGKILDSMLIGVLVYISISICGIPYALLIATIVAITDIVPIIGPFIGVIPSAVIIFLKDPQKVILFLICILVIQQIDGNIIAPKILGENTGVSSLCVIIAITTMGSLWGLAGMVLGVPLFATILELGNSYLERKLRAKGWKKDTDDDASGEPDGATESKGLLSRFKNRIRRLQLNAYEGGEGDLTPLERLQLETYALARKYHVFSESSDEALTRFSEDRAALIQAMDSVQHALSNEDPKQILNQEINIPDETQGGTENG